MFYPSIVLKNRGKFALIWLAATKGKKLNRRQLCSIDVTQASEDVISVISHHTLPGVNGSEYFSLYLSSELMSGLVEILDGQSKILLEDLKCLFMRIAGFKEKKADLEKRFSKGKLALEEEPNFLNVPLDFGHLGPIPEPSDHALNYEYFLVTTPKSSEDSIVSPVVADVGRFFDPTLDDIELLHTSRREDVTMPDVLPFHAEEPIPVTEEEPVDFLAPPLSFISDFPAPVQHLERDDLRTVESELVDQERAPSLCLSPEEEQTIAQSPVIADISTEIPTIIQRQKSVDSRNDTFALPTVIPDRRKKRKRRHLIIDSATTLSPEQIRRNIASANNNLTVSLNIPSTLESADSLLKRLGTGLVPKGINKRFKHLKTLPQPNEAIGHFMPEEEESEDVSGIQRFGISASEPVEQERAREAEDSKAKSLSGLLKSSTKTFEASSNVTTKLPEEIPCFSVDPREEDFEQLVIEPIPGVENVEPLFEVPEPDIRISEIQDETFQVQEKCIYSPVSPEYTPPPPSPPPMSDILNEAFELVKETALLSGFHNVTTFGAVIEKTDKTRKRVASLFNSLLFLMADGKILLQQPQEEIFIQIIEIVSP